MTDPSKRFGWGLISPAILVTFAILVLPLAFLFYVKLPQAGISPSSRAA